ncbi:hypothetical protein N7E02_07540 (plasmid) [Aliirhizobium terrae]|uniref:hypothetical protein n=1 Tax=Terrirhizobium terrae TaxID=2926709 RepID=UPI002578AE3C|nr:hypothetical protein [Rhizobium sp. CC-CFT758]WJH38463.1 hypothetical protein N7E02_07540 [Rhizobium sp. CC-CFT758]
MDNWRGEISDAVESLVERAVTTGARREDVISELLKSIEQLKLANDSDPERGHAPPQIVLDEPANDWPASDK